MLAIDVYMSGVYQVHGISPLRLFQWDASNLLGKGAYAGGFGSAGIGLALFTVLVGHSLFFGIPLALTARAVGNFQTAQSERSSER
jgi:hypothetical protein